RGDGNVNALFAYGRLPNDVASSVAWGIIGVDAMNSVEATGAGQSDWGCLFLPRHPGRLPSPLPYPLKSRSNSSM
ncbi:MAG: hypothetical protein KDJ65_27515, partial [Anaerolineae bacterium]|nr:hypothetical protein [Anaerolineae bacterium]